MIRHALLLRYTSKQAYEILLESFPLPSISLLNKIKQGGVDAIKAIKTLREKGSIHEDIILIVDEFYLQKQAQYCSGVYVGTDDNGILYKGVVAFMIVSLKKSIPYVIKAVPEVTISGKWLSEQISDSISSLSLSGFKIRGVVTDNHQANVNAFSLLHSKFGNQSNLFIYHPDSPNIKIYLFYDSVHIVKNIRNNLLHCKKFVFPSFTYNIKDDVYNCPAGYITWGDFHLLHSKDEQLQGNLKKAPKITYQSLHPGNKKQNVSLALSIFDETTIASFKSFFPERTDIYGFLSIFQKWWTVSNSKQQFSPNKLGNAIIFDDGKTTFFRQLADWIELWQKSPFFTLSKQTSSALITTLHSQAMLIDELIDEGYLYVLTSRLQSDPIERRFSQYRQMSGGRFLVSLLEVQHSEIILACRTLIKENVNFWDEDLKNNYDNPINDELLLTLDLNSNEISELTLSPETEEVATTIAGYIAKKLIKRSKCSNCKSMLATDASNVNICQYLQILSRGGLTVPSLSLKDFTCGCFAILDNLSNLITKQGAYVKDVSSFVLSKYFPTVCFTCDLHKEWGFKFASKIIINVFFNNKQKIINATVRKDAVISFKSRQREK